MQYLALETAEKEKLLAELEGMARFLEAALGALSSEDAVVSGPNGTFSPVEHCWHLADLEREGYQARIRRLLSEDDPLLPDFDGDRIARERRYKKLSLAEGLRAFRSGRAETLAMLLSITGDQWKRHGRQEGVGRVFICDLPAMIAAHDASHRGEIEAWMRERRA